MSDLSKKVSEAIKIIKLAEMAAEEKNVEGSIEINDYNGMMEVPRNTMEICYSSGKDSDVILHLARMAGVKYTAIRKDTSIDPPRSNQHARDNGAYIIKPKDTFFRLCERKGMPNRWSRFCCAYLKEYKILDVQLLGIRKEESAKRAERYQEPTRCRNFGKNEHVEQFLPILDWTNEDIEEFVKAENINLHPLYYREDGTLDVTKRLGCIGCPLASRKKQLAELKSYPRFVKRYAQCLEKYRKYKTERLRSQGASEEEIIESFCGTTNAYEHLYFLLFCDSAADFEYKVGGMFERLDCKAAMEQYFNINLTL